jgi:indole-3-acetate monooxygenase
MTVSTQPITSTSSFTLGVENPFRVDASLLETAATLAPIIREYAGVAELNGRLARPVIDAMRAAGMYRMFTPRALGGLEVDPVTFCRVAETIAGFDSAAAWSLQAGNTGAWWASHFSEAGVAELFADGPDVLMAASFSPPHRAVEVPGGYQLTGRGPLASTIHDCSWVMMTGIVFDGETPRMTPAGPEIVALTMRTSEVEIVDTWRSLGMRGTDSNDVAASDVYVPRARAFHVTPEFERAREFRGPLYRLPALVSVSAVIGPVALAIARGAITEVRELADRRTPLGAMKTMRHRSAVQATLADAEALLRSARLLFYDTIATAWRRAVEGEPFTLEHKADLMLAGAHAVRTASRVTDDMHRMGGSSGVYARSRLERHFRDAQTVRHHGFLCESRLETVGQVYLGVEPDFPMVAF